MLKSRAAMPIARLRAVVNMMAPRTNNSISLQDIAAPAMRPQPSRGLVERSRLSLVTRARMMIAGEWYAAKAEARRFTSCAGETAAAIRQFCGVRVF